MKRSLEVIAELAGTDKYQPHGYIPHYERHFEPLRHQPVRLLEIGVASRASLVMWDDYFDHKNTRITGVDIDPDCYDHVADRVDIIIADGTKLDLWGHTYDIIIDDGSHVSQDIIDAFTNSWHAVAMNGWYVIEDWAVQTRVDYGGDGWSSPATGLVSDLFSSVLLNRGPTLGISEVHAYEEILFLRKGRPQ